MLFHVYHPYPWGTGLFYPVSYRLEYTLFFRPWLGFWAMGLKTLFNKVSAKCLNQRKPAIQTKNLLIQ
jgi:hypothetical protein